MLSGSPLKFHDLSLMQVVEIDLGAVVPCVSGPKRPHDIITLTELQEDFRRSIIENVSFKVLAIYYRHFAMLISMIYCYS